MLWAFKRGGDLCVVDLNAGDGMFDDEFAPVFIDFGCVGQKVENLFDFCQFGIGFGDGETQTVFVSGARADVPEFRDVLQSYKKRVASFQQFINRIFRFGVMRAVRFDKAQENICVGEKIHLCRLSCSS